MESNKVQNYKSCFDILVRLWWALLLHILRGRLRLVLLRDNYSVERQRMCVATIMSHSAETHKGHGTDFCDY